jgi:hypothetical protein
MPVSLHVIVLLPTLWAIGLSQQMDHLQGLRSALVFTRQRVQDDHGDAQADPRPVANAFVGGGSLP